MYRVWYWLDGELRMMACGNWPTTAVRALVAYYNVPNYMPWLEYIADPKRR